MSGLFNHRSALIIDIFKKISDIMPGSYGLLYIHDEEDDKNEIDHSNEFVVWKLARSFEPRKGSFFIPIYSLD
ncbi:immunity 7 family protein [Leptospira kirschneri]|uniref:Uncharacterized protein n=1 Tax=Leptospira kirschneri str. H1 TaxID=1049966 RepID=A0A0E2B5G4_9LEPT|nr:Imm7 family immunity protein [Leptospira kirschneri]EKO16524.1 hypothetical protein LEP1GSC081_2892 [Leptospira kirschneri str. H1]UML80552.1 immunity 7 family protein [Leptospira kirschneri]